MESFKSWQHRERVGGSKGEGRGKKKEKGDALRAVRYENFSMVASAEKKGK